MFRRLKAFAPAKPNARPRAVLFAIATVAGVAELAYAVMNVSAMPVYLKFSMHYGEASVAAIGTAFLVCEGITKGFFGALGDRIGRKRLILAGPMISVVTALLTLAVQPHQWYFFVALRVLDGLGAAALWPSALAMIADVIEEDRRSQAMSLFNVTYLMGIALGPLIGGAANDITALFTQKVPRMMARHSQFMAKHFHEHLVDPRQASFYVVAFLFLLTALVALWRVPDIRPHHIHARADLETGFNLKALMTALRQIPMLLLMTFITFLGIGMVMLIIKLFAMAEFDVSEVRFGALLLVPALVIAAASVPLGSLGDIMGKVRAVRWGIGVCAVSMLSLVLIKNQIALVLGGSLIGVGFVVAFPAWMALISSSCDPRQRGAVMGAVGTAQGLGAMIGAPIGGWLYEHARIPLPFVHTHHPNHYVPFVCCALLLFTAWILSITSIKDDTKHDRNLAAPAG
jgi:DHA1 family multidrug resistance protein-like MFS transporter